MKLGKLRQSERLRLIRCRINGRRESSSSEQETSKCISLVTDDRLQEIFVRLPDSRSVIKRSSFCKRWFSVVSSRSQGRGGGGGLYFLRKLNHHHRLKRQHKQEQEKLPYTLLMRPTITFRGRHATITYPTSQNFSTTERYPYLLLVELKLKVMKLVILIFCLGRACTDVYYPR